MGSRASALALLLGALLFAVPASGLPAQSAVLKRNRAKRKRAGEQRLLNETQRPGGNHVAAALQRYLSNSELAAALKDLEKRCKGMARLVQFGSSAKGRCGGPTAASAAHLCLGLCQPGADRVLCRCPHSWQCKLVKCSCRAGSCCATAGQP